MIEPRSDPSMDIGGGKKEGKKSFGVQITTGQKLKKYGRRNPAQFRVLKGAPRTSTVPSFWSGVLRTSRGRGGRLDGGQSPSVAAGWVQGGPVPAQQRRSRKIKDQADKREGSTYPASTSAVVSLSIVRLRIAADSLRLRQSRCYHMQSGRKGKTKKNPLGSTASSRLAGEKIRKRKIPRKACQTSI